MDLEPLVVVPQDKTLVLGSSRRRLDDETVDKLETRICEATCALRDPTPPSVEHALATDEEAGLRTIVSTV
ncbi:MAG: hypothetical protein M3228_12605 [Actinomycetota bacterium]|nr:hypothetical protein [Actinomycetota bacterium]